MQSGCDNISVSVVYLSWLPYGIDYLKNFIESYKNHSPGLDHRLVLIFNGVAHSDKLKDFIAYSEQHLEEFQIFTMNSGQDIEAYFTIADQLTSEYILFLNSFSLFNTGEWLKVFVDSMSPEMGVVGASGSFQSLYSTVNYENAWSWENKLSLHQQFRKYKLLLKNKFYWRFLIKSFPNPHIRTNAFMVRRSEFISIKRPKLKRKFDAYLFESGKKSLTNQMLKKGFQVALVGKNRQKYLISDWPDSKIFWVNEQENLLVRDNQTDLYEKSDVGYRLKLTKLAWGL